MDIQAEANGMGIQIAHPQAEAADIQGRGKPLYPRDLKSCRVSLVSCK